MNTRAAEYLKKRVKVTDTGCWEWNLSRNHSNYGTARYLNKGWLTHRLAWQAFKGQIPLNKLVCHHCDNPPCCNPSHLFIGTHRDNARDAIKKHGHRGGFQKGQANGMSKLTDDAVSLIRMLRQEYSLRELAYRFDVSMSLISLVCLGKAWRHI